MDSRLSKMNNFSNPAYWRALETCPLCGGTNFGQTLLAHDPHYGLGGDFSIHRCADCGLQFLNPQPTAKYLSQAYPDDFYSYQVSEAAKPGAMAKIKNAIKAALGYQVGKTGDPAFAKPGKMLDIGCGSGAFLAQMREQGWQVRGVEMSVHAARAGREQRGIDIFGGRLEEANLPSAEFDYVRLNHTFEHLDNPRDVLREIRRILKSEGKLFIGVPNVDSVPAKWFGRYWYNLGPPVHPFGYSPRSLSRLLEQEGFAVEKVRCNSKHASLLGSFQIYLNRPRSLPSDVGNVIRNPVLMLFGQWAAKALDAIGSGDCFEVIAHPDAR